MHDCHFKSRRAAVAIRPLATPRGRQVLAAAGEDGVIRPRSVESGPKSSICASAPAKHRNGVFRQQAGNNDVATSNPAAFSEKAGKMIRVEDASTQGNDCPANRKTGWRWPEITRGDLDG